MLRRVWNGTPPKAEEPEQQLPSKQGKGGGKEEVARFKYIPYLHEATTVISLLLIPWCFYMFWNDSRRWPLLIAYLVIVPVAGELIRHFGTVLGMSLSKSVHQLGICSPGSHHPLAKRAAQVKWRRQFWQCVVHVAFTVLELYILFQLPKDDERWPDLWTNPKACWNPLPMDEAPYTPALVDHVYMAQLWVWAYTSFYHVFIDELQKDYYESIIHHIATVALVGYSGSSGFQRIGLVVLLLNDGVDVSVDVLRLVNFLRMRGREAFFAAEAVFMITIAHFYSWRAWLAPAMVVDNTRHGLFLRCNSGPHPLSPGLDVEPLRLDNPALPANAYGDTWAGAGQCIWDHVTDFDWKRDRATWGMAGALAGLMTLQVLHLIWCYMLGRILVRIATAGSEVGSKSYEGTSASDDAAGQSPKQPKAIAQPLEAAKEPVVVDKKQAKKSD